MLFDILLIIVSNSEFIILSTTFANARPSLALTSLFTLACSRTHFEWSLTGAMIFINYEQMLFFFGIPSLVRFRYTRCFAFSPFCARQQSARRARSSSQTPKRKLLRFSLNLTEQTLSCVGIHKLKNIIFEFVLIWFWRVAMACARNRRVSQSIQFALFPIRHKSILRLFRCDTTR